MLKIKIIIVGDMFCGKSSILERYKNNEFNINKFSTIGVDFYSTTIKKESNQKEYNLFIWDTSGQEKFNSIVSSYYRNIAVAIIVFDISNFKSFKNLKTWIDTLYHYCNKNILLKIVGNKSDIKDREIPKTNILKFCNEYGIDYFETSAKYNINITELFDNIIEDIDEKIKLGLLKPNESLGLNKIDQFIIKEPYSYKPNKCCRIL